VLVQWLLGALALLSLALTLWQWLVARRFPLHRRAANPDFAPGVTLCKPLKGCDAETAACLESWFAQDYAGPVQILFGVAAADDPVVPLVRRLIAAHPERDAQLLLLPDRLGPNAKVSKLAQLERHARHDLLVVSDADVCVPPDLLTQAVAPLRDARVGLVNCFYRLANPANVAMRLEALAVNADFWSQVLQARSLKPLDFALGAVMVTRRAHLAAIGGFAALVDCLADDYQLGHRIARTGATLALCPVVVECRSAPLPWRAVWAHQLRWARTIRVCQPLPFFCSILSNATLWPVLWLAAAPSVFSAAGAALCLAVRALTAWANERKLAPASSGAALWLAPLKDLLACVVWAQAFLGNRVTWRGERFRVTRDGRLVQP
jgi:ceramide glucosyltransferase